MNKRRKKQIWLRIISCILIMTMLVNDFLGTSYIVLATEQTTGTDTLTTEDSSEEEYQTVLISEEDTSKRSANMKYFVNEDHSYTAAVYADPIHYLDNGEWKEIDNQLQDGETEEGMDFWENKKNTLSVITIITVSRTILEA